jgi:hypothetical protein
MISQIYHKYFQKSFTFLYPLLGFKRTKHPRPVQTFLIWKDTILDDPQKRKLVCVYEKKDTEEWRNFESNFLITHKQLETCVPISDKTIVYVFDFNCFSADYDYFLKGKYSQMSSAAKKMLTDFYGTHTPEWVYIESFLFPAKYFKMYAQILDMEESLLKSVGELCDRFNLEKETCLVTLPDDIELFINP